MESTPGLTFQNILPLILAILLIFLIPMLMRRYGLEWEDLIRLLEGTLCGFKKTSCPDQFTKGLREAIG